MKKLTLATLFVLFFLALPLQAGMELLHQFAPSNNQGCNPLGDLVGDGSYFYGMTSRLGQFNGGTIFRIKSDGSGFLLLHAFAGGAADGADPGGSLIVSGTTLYGLSMNGGDNDKGTVFKLHTDGSGFVLLHEFAGGAADGAYPRGSLIISGTTLYGLTAEGGGSDVGTVFKIGVAGTGFALLHAFNLNDGAYPAGSLVISGTTLYGLTYGRIEDFESDQEDPWGTIFRIGINGSGFSRLHEFNYDDGGWPLASLVVSGTTLYGMAHAGGPSGEGVIFKIGTAGRDFSVLHAFSGGAADGSDPKGSLIVSGGTLYGMTRQGGDRDQGTVFKMRTDGAGFALLHEFAGGAPDGKNPYGSLILCGSVLYGMTYAGGAADAGVIFSLPLSLIVTSPNGGEGWAVGTTHDIAWKAPDSIAEVRIELSTHNARDWSEVSAATANDGGFSWTVPYAPSPQCLVGISDAADAAVSDVSDAVFAILASDVDLRAERCEVRAFSLVRPYGQIQFTAENSASQVAQFLLLRRRGSGDFILLKEIAPSQLQDNQFQMQDKYLEKDKPYTYKVEAYNEAGQVIGRSAEKTI